jgi:hypothetical protein
LLVDLQSSTSDVKAAKVTDFICTPLTSLARSKHLLFFPAWFDIIVFLRGVFGLGALSAGLLAHGMRRDENVHLR